MKVFAATLLSAGLLFASAAHADEPAAPAAPAGGETAPAPAPTDSKKPADADKKAGKKKHKHSKKAPDAAAPAAGDAGK